MLCGVPGIVMSALRLLASLLGLGVLAHVMAFDRTRMDNVRVSLVLCRVYDTNFHLQLAV